MLSIWQVILALAAFAAIVLAETQNFKDPPTLLPRPPNSPLRTIRPPLPPSGVPIPPGPTPGLPAGLPPGFRSPRLPNEGLNNPPRPGGRFGRQIDFTAFANNLYAIIQNATRTIPRGFASNIFASFKNATRNIPTSFANNLFAIIQNATRTIPTSFASNIFASIQNATRTIPGFSALAAFIPGIANITRIGWCKPQKLDTFQEDVGAKCIVMYRLEEWK